MSNTPFIWNPYTVFIVEYSWLDGYELKKFDRVSVANSEEEALKESEECLLVRNMPLFHVRIKRVHTQRKKVL